MDKVWGAAQVSGGRRLIKRETVTTTLIVIILLFMAVITTMPFVWMVLTGFKTEIEAMRIPMQFLPDQFRLDNFETLFTRFNFVTFYINTIIVTIAISVGQVFLSAMAAYAFARIEFPFKNVIFITMMAALMIPLQLILVPRFIVMMHLGWVDSLLGVIGPGIPSVFATFFIRQTIMSIPRELDESAVLDGCSHPRIFWSIIMPLCKSTLAAMGILVVTFAWNNLLWPLIVLNSNQNFTLAIGIANLRGQHATPFNLLMSAATVSTIPIIIIFLIGQRYFLEGITTTGSKS